MIDPHQLLAIADEAVDRVVPPLVDAMGGAELEARAKSTQTDMVTEMDHWSEVAITDAIRAQRPSDGFIGEEGTSEDGRSGVVWLIDPIDGTTNYMYDLPGSSVSVAAAVDGEVVAGVVHDLVRDERFRALDAGGSTLDGHDIEASAKTDLTTTLLATGFSYDPDRRREQAEALVGILPVVRDIRRFGGAAVDLCSVACGRVDGYFETGLNPWDHAAGALIAREAGARVDARPDGTVVAAGRGLFDELRHLLVANRAVSP